MPTQEINRSQWREFLDNFSRQHEGWLVSVEVAGRDIGDQVEVNSLPLVGISADVRRHENDIVVTVGNGPQDEVNRVIYQPARLAFQQSDDGLHAALEVESADGDRTIVRFISASAPETVDRLRRELPKARGAGFGTLRREDEEGQ